MDKLKPGIPAKNRYNPIRYSFVPVEAGEEHLLTSDPWSYLATSLLTQRPSTRGRNRQNIERAFYFARLAEEFYRAAESTSLPAKGTLTYYGMLNLVKCYLSAKGVELESSYEHHGLQLPLGQKGVVEVKKPSGTASVNIFAKFSYYLNVPIVADVQFSLRDALYNVPEIHGIFCSITGVKRKLLPADIAFLVNEKKNCLFTEVSYKKEQENKVDCTRFLKGARANYFQPGSPRDGYVVCRSKARKPFGKENLTRKYRNILSDYDHFDIVSILTRQGYRYYFDLKPGNFRSLSFSLASMFYLGSAARYRPVEIEAVLNGELRPAITELMSVTPQQFLYHLVSHITGRECVIPFSKL